jgi:probable phosphoglycerate mutase
MTTLLLIRHAHTDAIGKLFSGWMPGWHLNPRGKREAERLTERLGKVPLAAIYTSPLERVIETAEPIARDHGLEPRVLQDLGEVRMGEWEGKSFAELAGASEWADYNQSRSSVRPPGGELMIECQARMVKTVERLAQAHPEETIAIVSHGDPIRSLLTYFLGIPIDLLQRFEISPASISVAQVAPWGPRVLCINHTEEFAA